MHVISPRVFEAASLGTAMIMFPGEYSGVIAPNEHYIPLEKDFSNMREVVDQLRDETLVTAMTARAYDELIRSGRWSYKTFIEGFDDVIDEEAKVKRGPAPAPRWRLAKAERSFRVPGMSVRFFRAAHAVSTRFMRRDPSMRFDIEYDSQIQKAWLAVRIALRDRSLRSLLLLGRRSGAPLDRLLREILELWLLRRAAAGTLPAGQNFTLSAELDPARGALCFVSNPTGEHTDHPDRRGREIRAALSAGGVRVVEWDHRALGGRIQLDRPQMEVGIGFEGLESFTVLAGLGRQHPTALERALEPLLGPAASVPTAPG